MATKIDKLFHQTEEVMKHNPRLASEEEKIQWEHGVAVYMETIRHQM